MTNKKISALTAATTPLAGTEVLPIVQSSATTQVSVANLTAGRAVSALSLTSTTTLGVTGVSTLTGGAVIQGLTVGLGANAVANNTAVGVGALASGSLSGAYNVAIGPNALTSAVAGTQNTVVGAVSGSNITSGSYNVAIGVLSLQVNISGNYNTAIGTSSLPVCTGGSNVALGFNAGSALTTGNNNTIIGSVAGTAGLSDTVIIAAGSAERMRIDSSGIVTMPAYGAGAATFSAAGVISSVSDETYKIKDGVIADPMPMIMALEPGYYYGKPEANMGDGRQLGFYAQNVRAAIGPEAAPDPEPSKPWGYYDRSVLAVAIEAIKVQQAQITALTARIAALEAK